MTIELPERLEVALKAHAEASGLSPDLYVCNLIERDLGEIDDHDLLPPFKSGLGMWKKYGVSISEEEIDENRADMFRGFGENF